MNHHSDKSRIEAREPCSEPRRSLRRLCLTISGVFLLLSFAFAQKNDSCLDCHSQMEGALGEPAKLMTGDIHKARGLSCSDCHGGDPAIADPAGAMSKAKGFIGRPKAQDIPAFCGKCHSNAEFIKKFNPTLRVDQEQAYFTSVHGKLLKSGDQNVATCASCHGAHGVRSITDPLSKVYALNVAETCGKCHGDGEYMKNYKIPHDQYDKYKSSVHAKALYEKQDLSAPTCNDCHGNHGAAPPGIASVANVCGQCHVRQAELFSASTHKPVFDAMQVGECKQCHSNHDIHPPSDEMIGVGQNSVCTSCHVKGDSGYEAADHIRRSMDDISARMASALAVLGRAERAGMDVSRPRFNLNEAKDGLTHARVLVHSASIEQVDKVVQPALAIADQSRQAGEDALSELMFRRKGLGVSLFFILFLAALIYLKIRQVDSRQKADEPSH